MSLKHGYPSFVKQGTEHYLVYLTSRIVEHVRGKRFARGDAFIGYQKDTPAAVVFQASNFLRRLKDDNTDVVESKLEVLNRAGILNHMSLDMLLDREDFTEPWRAAVCDFSYCYTVFIQLYNL